MYQGNCYATLNTIVILPFIIIFLSVFHSCFFFRFHDDKNKIQIILLDFFFFFFFFLAFRAISFTGDCCCCCCCYCRRCSWCPGFSTGKHSFNSCSDETRHRLPAHATSFLCFHDILLRDVHIKRTTFFFLYIYYSEYIYSCLYFILFAFLIKRNSNMIYLPF